MRSGVIPVLVTGIKPTARTGAGCEMDPGNKCRDDTAVRALVEAS
jgi:hypothetical protein